MKRRASSGAIKRAVFLLAAIVILGGCVGQEGGAIMNIMDIQMSGGGVEDMTITAKVPEFARSGSDFGWQLVVEPTINIRDFRAEIYDRGLFTPVSEPDFKTASIRANTTKTFPISYKMGDVGLAEKTDITMRSFYKSNTTLSTTVAVLSEVEYFQRKAQGKLGEIPISTWSSTNPLELTVSWSDPMPLLDAQAVQMYVDYRNSGNGFIENLTTGEVTFTVPGNIEFVSCDDYKMAGEKLTLKRDLDFVQKQAKRSTCTFKANASGTIDSRSLVGTALYTYEIDSEVTVPIIQK